MNALVWFSLVWSTGMEEREMEVFSTIVLVASTLNCTND